MRDSACRAAIDAADEVVGEKVANMAWNAVLHVTDYCVFGCATIELIASHKLLEQNKTLVALPICFKIMKISQIHQRFFEKLNEPRALTNPEDFLGPNWKEVINFWFYVDGLSSDEKLKKCARYLSLNSRLRQLASVAINDVAKEVVGEDVRYAAYCVNCLSIFGYATLELIAQHKLLEQNWTPLALPLCINQ